ncbi:nuclear transport factor 2 family protein [Pseudonocardia sp. ICBG1122]|nr:nuclear transport factor 2 family protein [Pseudonocardia pini]
MISTDTLADLEEIRALNARYNFAVDQGTPEEWAATFSTDGVFHALIEGQTPKGHAELAAFVPLCRDTFDPMRHLTMNEVVSVSGDTATQTCYLLFFANTAGTVSGTVCVYTDELVREDGAWRYRDRKVAPVMPFTSFAPPA